MYTDTVTFFNKYVDEAGDIYWYPHILSKVDLNMDKAANAAKTGLDSTDTANLHIKYRVIAGKRMIGKLLWLPPKEWKTQGDLLKSITFADGDFFMAGEYTEDPVKNSDYENRANGGFYDYLNKSRDYVFLVTNVKGPYKVIPHFEIGGK